MNIIKTIKTFLIGTITGIISSVILFFYIKTKCKKLLKLQEIFKHEKNKDIFSSNNIKPKSKDITERGHIRQRDTNNRGSRDISGDNLEGNLQCRQLEREGQRPEQRRTTKGRNSKRKLLRDSGQTQEQIQSDINIKPNTKTAKLGNGNRKRTNNTNKRNKQKLE